MVHSGNDNITINATIGLLAMNLSAIFTLSPALFWASVFLEKCLDLHQLENALSKVTG